MLSIAICDDDKAICSEVEGYLEESLKKNNCGYNIEVYTSGERLLNNIRGGESYDIIFLDIEFGSGINGIDVGTQLRDVFLNEATKIIYVSAKESYAIQLFDTRPFDFIVKPVSFENIDFLINKFLKLYPDSNDVFEYQIQKENFEVKIHNILYFESDDRKIRMITSDGECIVFYGSISEIKFGMKRFSQIKLNANFFIFQLRRETSEILFIFIGLFTNDKLLAEIVGNLSFGKFNFITIGQIIGLIIHILFDQLQSGALHSNKQTTSTENIVIVFENERARKGIYFIDNHFPSTQIEITNAKIDSLYLGIRNDAL